jgi:hypothetical protein
MFREFFDDIDLINEIFGFKRIQVLQNDKTLTVVIKLGDITKYNIDKISAEILGESLVLNIPFKVEKKLIPLKVIDNDEKMEENKK